MAKKHYRIRNWKDYNRSLVERGNITFWVSEMCYNNGKIPVAKGSADVPKNIPRR